jgi:hypothetical protein
MSGAARPCQRGLVCPRAWLRVVMAAHEWVMLQAGLLPWELQLLTRKALHALICTCPASAKLVHLVCQLDLGAVAFGCTLGLSAR